MPGTTISITPITPPSAGLVSAPHTPRLVFQDVVDQLLDYLGADASGEALRNSKEAALTAYTEFATAARWSFYQSHGRVVLNETYTEGTIEYDHTGGAYERMVTLTGGTWPDWALYGSIRVGDVTYDVDRRISSTILTLDSQVNPGDDLDADTDYTLYRDTYTLPEDFQAAEAHFYENTVGRLCYLSPAEWLASIRRSDYSGQPLCYTITGDPRRPGRMALRIVPYSTEARTLDFLYQRLPRKISTLAYSTGTVTVSAGGSGTTTVTGSGTAWIGLMAGSVIRLSVNGTDLPTRLAGENPYVVERTILTVDSATQITVDELILDSYSAVKYLISDPVDIELGAMRVAFQRCAEKQVAITRVLKDKPSAFRAYDEALILAREADARDFGPRAAGMRRTWHDPIGAPFGRQGADIAE